ncbi:hypothetical protein UCDDS831_g02050 [Diplodia seriata]|uniref:Synaptobrevin n=2 Tax=Diplodia seriata TaxID=420778 RepID=A0A0G2ETQ9_9PEZI|nr:hypothetical protein UCDDS831_g02050 [Diplodia seriata]
MARTQALPAHQPDPTQISLTRLLDRLQTALLSPHADPKLRSSSFERTKVGANLEYARSLLLRLEHDTAAVKIQSRKQAQQADLQAKRDLIKQLNQRLYELNQLDDDADAADDDPTDDDDDDDETAPPSYAPAHRNTSDGLNVEHNPGNQALQDAAENILRSRRPAGGRSQADHPPSSSEANAAATATATATGSSPSSLFGASKNAAADPTLRRSEKLMSHNRSEQETLTGSLLDMARMLKEQTMHFGSSLEAEKDILDRAGKGLDTSAQGMEAAGQRMGTLRRMTEGKGWWARVKLYGIIAALWTACFLVMFVMPKLRF